MSSKLIVDTIEDSTGTYSLALGSGNSTFPGGIHIGGTGSANLLDDYEEGTFTPTLAGGTTAGTYTYTHQAGRYTKIGNTVTVHINIAATVGSPAPTGSQLLKGMPFVANGESSGTFQVNDMGSSYQSNVGQYTSLIQSGDDYIHFRGTNTDGGAYDTLGAQSLSYIRITLTYTTNS